MIVLDEVDQLDSKGQEVLYTLFEWPALPNSKLLLIGMYCFDFYRVSII